MKQFIEGIPMMYWAIAGLVVILLVAFLRPRKSENYGFRFPKRGPAIQRRRMFDETEGMAGAGVGAKRPVPPAPLAGHNHLPTE